MSAKTLVNFTRGIDRSRPQSTAKQDTFWNLVNCYVTPGGTIAKRPGFKRIAQLDSHTHGLFSNKGALHAFYSQGNPTAPSENVVKIQYHALRNGSDTVTLKKVWHDFLYLGNQYVVAEMDDGHVQHFWLRAPDTWKANTMYQVNGTVQPTTPNGFYYVAAADELPPEWKADTQYEVGDVVQPTEYNGFKYTVQSVSATPAHSSSTEPDWPASEGATIKETGGTDGSSLPAGSPEPPPVSVGDGRYDNLPGGKVS